MWFRISVHFVWIRMKCHLYTIQLMLFRISIFWTCTLFSVRMVLWVGMFHPLNNSAPPVSPTKKNGTMESFPHGKDILQTRTACGSITGYSFNLFTQVLVFPVKLTWMKSIPMESPCTTSNMSRGINSSEPWMMNWLASTLRFTRNIPALELIGLVLRLCLCFRLCVHSLCFD